MVTMSKDAVAQAQIALRNFRALQPTLTQYARMLTGNPAIRVVAAAHDNGSTDGKVINYRPPISLGKVIAHQRWFCDKRDEVGLMRCTACAQREDVIVTIYHEIAHIWFNSFQELTPEAKETAIRAAVAEVDSVYGEKVREKIAAYKDRLGYMGLASFVSPFLPIILNGLEDARVNRMLFGAMPGTKVMFDASTAQIFRDGVEHVATEGDDEGEWVTTRWSDRPLNSQAMIGVFCMASGYDFSDWLCEFVVTALKDDELRELVGQINTAPSMSAVFSLAFPILARLRELGFCRNEEDPEDDYEPPFDEEGDDEDEDDGGSDSEGESSEGPEGDDQSESAPDPESTPESGSGGDDSQPADDGSGGDESGPSDGEDEPSDNEDGEVDGNTGGDSPDGSPERSEGDGADADAPDGGDDSGAADSDPDGGEGGSAGGEVPEEDHDRGESESDAATGAEDSADLRDGDSSGREDVERPADEAGGDEGVGERRSGSDDNADADLSGEVGSAGDGDPGLDESGDSSEPIDTGDGPKKGIRVEGELVRPTKPELPWGDAETVEVTVHELGDHELPGSVHSHDGGEPHEHVPSDEDKAGDAVVKAVIVAGVYFEMPSANVTGVSIKTEANGFFEKDYGKADMRTRGLLGMNDCDPQLSLISPVIARARVVFADNLRGHHELGLRRGRIHGSSLGMKAPVGDGTFFRQARLPGRVDYFVGIGIDVSASTSGRNIQLAKQVAFAEAEVLHALGIRFFMYAHSGSYEYSDDFDKFALNLDIIEVKRADEIWNDQTRERLRKLGPQAANLDGHTIQFYRKQLEKQTATRKILHYYSDGAMPCENYQEELEILRDEIKRYKKAGIILEGVGIRDDAPRQYGLPTVRVDEQSDVMLVIENLGKRLAER